MSTQERSDDSGEHGYGSAKQDANIDAAKGAEGQGGGEEERDDVTPSDAPRGGDDDAP